ncbi:4847_t:CDS:2 [Funneliformis geosporum]|uniref:7259_t:CDS:1 n=1 Tax=Funneliformis geosporum TaxID=1117311 RepID=A0A9W4SC10_9GLOM|nr:7259_t:CDS:2 [Funneliformis geosporum]CAI2164721.1 4847_t:CDS:2 [Funneliformis geosporum]
MSTNARDIPAIKKAEPGTPLPPNYSTTPLGTIYSSTPGGSKIMYDRTTLLNLANSPLAKTPPSNLAYVPGVTKVPYHVNNDNSSKPDHNNNNTAIQVEGHLAPPKVHPFPGLQQQGGNDNKHNDTADGESGDEDVHDNKEHQDHGVFDMDME